MKISSMSIPGAELIGEDCHPRDGYCLRGVAVFPAAIKLQSVPPTQGNYLDLISEALINGQPRNHG